MLRSEISEATGINIKTINNEIKRGNLITVEIDGRVLIMFDDFLTWITATWSNGNILMNSPEYIMRYLYTFGIMDKYLERCKKYGLLYI